MNLLATAALGIAGLNLPTAPLSTPSDCKDFSGQYRLVSCSSSNNDITQVNMSITQTGCSYANIGVATTIGMGGSALTLYSAETFLTDSKHTEIDESEANPPTFYSQSVTRARWASAEVLATESVVSGWYLEGGAGSTKKEYEYTSNNEVSLRGNQLVIVSTVVYPSQVSTQTCIFDRQ